MAEQIISKRCPECNQVKPLSEFYKDRTKRYGFQSNCKSCKKRYQQTEKCKAADKRYRQSEKGKTVHRKANKKYQKTTKGKVALQAGVKRFLARHPNHTKARIAVNNAIRDGKLPHLNILQCHYCPEKAQQYHHWSYKPEHWLHVIPVCMECHKKIRSHNAESDSLRPPL